MGEWYYIGHYGQLGPLTRDQIDELIEGEVIARDTYVWKIGMTNWLPAGQCPELASVYNARAPIENIPPPPPGPPLGMGNTMPQANINRAATYNNYPSPYGSVRSDKSRALAGILQLILPGIGRIYLGYAAFGVLQLLFSLCGVGVVWSFIDGIVILAGGVKMDGYGRQLGE